MSGSRFPWRTLLFVSLALNILLIGVGVGAFIGREPAAMAAAPMARLAAPRAVMAALPADARAEVRTALVRAWRATRDERRELRAANAEVMELVRADAYDAAAMQAALERQRAARNAVTAIFHDAVADAFAKLTPEQRRQIADALAERRANLDRLAPRNGQDRIEPDNPAKRSP